jgi:hypothetical protein
MCLFTLSPQSPSEITTLNKLFPFLRCNAWLKSLELAVRGLDLSASVYLALCVAPLSTLFDSCKMETKVLEWSFHPLIPKVMSSCFVSFFLKKSSLLALFFWLVLHMLFPDNQLLMNFSHHLSEIPLASDYPFIILISNLSSKLHISILCTWVYCRQIKYMFTDTLIICLFHSCPYTFYFGWSNHHTISHPSQIQQFN